MKRINNFIASLILTILTMFLFELSVYGASKLFVVDFYWLNGFVLFVIVFVILLRKIKSI